MTFREYHNRQQILKEDLESLDAKIRNLYNAISRVSEKDKKKAIAAIEANKENIDDFIKSVEDEIKNDKKNEVYPEVLKALKNIKDANGAETNEIAQDRAEEAEETEETEETEDDAETDFEFLLKKKDSIYKLLNQHNSQQDLSLVNLCRNTKEGPELISYFIVTSILSKKLQKLQIDDNALKLKINNSEYLFNRINNDGRFPKVEPRDGKDQDTHNTFTSFIEILNKLLIIKIRDEYANKDSRLKAYIDKNERMDIKEETFKKVLRDVKNGVIAKQEPEQNDALDGASEDDHVSSDEPVSDSRSVSDSNSTSDSRSVSDSNSTSGSESVSDNNTTSDSGTGGVSTRDASDPKQVIVQDIDFDMADKKPDMVKQAIENTFGKEHPKSAFVTSIERLKKAKERIQSRAAKDEVFRRRRSVAKDLEESYSPVFNEIMNNPLLKEEKEFLTEANILSKAADLGRAAKARLGRYDALGSKANDNWKDNLETDDTADNDLVNYQKEMMAKAEGLEADILDTSNSKAKVVNTIAKLKKLASEYQLGMYRRTTNVIKSNSTNIIGKIVGAVKDAKGKIRDKYDEHYLNTGRGRIRSAEDPDMRKSLLEIKENPNKLPTAQKKVLCYAAAYNKQYDNQNNEYNSKIIPYDDGKKTLKQATEEILKEIYPRYESSMYDHFMGLIKRIWGDNIVNKYAKEYSYIVDKNRRRNVPQGQSENNSKNSDSSGDRAEGPSRAPDPFKEGQTLLKQLLDGGLKAENLSLAQSRSVQQTYNSLGDQEALMYNGVMDKVNRAATNTGRNLLQNQKPIPESFFTKTKVILEDGEEIQVKTADAEKAVLMALSMDQGTSAQGKKWIVDNMYKGNPEAEKLVDEFIKKNSKKRAKADEALRGKQKVAPAPGGNPVGQNGAAPVNSAQPNPGAASPQTPAPNPAVPALPQQAMNNQQQNPPVQAAVTTAASDGFPNRLYKKIVRRKLGF